MALPEDGPQAVPERGHRWCITATTLCSEIHASCTFWKQLLPQLRGPLSRGKLRRGRLGRQARVPAVASRLRIMTAIHHHLSTIHSSFLSPSASTSASWMACLVVWLRFASLRDLCPCCLSQVGLAALIYLLSKWCRYQEVFQWVTWVPNPLLLTPVAWQQPKLVLHRKSKWNPGG